MLTWGTSRSERIRTLAQHVILAASKPAIQAAGNNEDTQAIKLAAGFPRLLEGTTYIHSRWHASIILMPL